MNEILERHFVGKIAQKVLLVKGNKVLITRDSRDEVWELPGGRLNLDENPTQGIVRELQEELGVSVTIGKVVYINQFVHGIDNSASLVIVYEASLIDENAVMNVDPIEVGEMAWVDATNWDAYTYYTEYAEALKTYFTS